MLSKNDESQKSEALRRSIRSYTRRQGRMTEGQRRAIREFWPKFGIDCNGDDGILNLQNHFPHNQPLVLEIGFGMGKSLAQNAADYPNFNFVGVEVYQPGIGALLKEIETLALTNLKIIEKDAVILLQNHLPLHCIERVHIFFPDPWPKKRHQKRRLINTAFLQQLAQILQPNGILHIATDWREYAEQLEALFAKQNNFLRSKTVPSTFRPLTKYEKRGISLGNEVFDLVFTRNHCP